MNEKYNIKTKYFEGEVYLLKLEYANGRAAIRVYDAQDSSVVMTATKNVVDVNLPEGYTIIKNVDENDGILEELVRLGIVEDKGKIPFGHYELNLVKLI